jgi:hypothetical protein
MVDRFGDHERHGLQSMASSILSHDNGGASSFARKVPDCGSSGSSCEQSANGAKASAPFVDVRWRPKSKTGGAITLRKISRLYNCIFGIKSC